MFHVPRVTLPIWAALLLFAGCGSDVNIRAVPEAIAKCEQPTQDLNTATPLMLPGRVCQSCHRAEGQAQGYTWTASGTVFGSPDSPCNSGGVEGAQVDILDGRGEVILSLTTNRSGNFFTSESRDFSLTRARISKGGKVREMQGLQTTTACATCHYPGGPPPGRVYLD